jgi:hypothetical protein
VHIDLLGPLKSDTDNKYILAITDAFTKVAALVALPDKEAPTVAEAILYRWVYRFSVPLHIVSDQGKEFCNKVLDELCELLGSRRSTTAPYHPQSNAQVERLNRTILDYLRAEIPDDSKHWEACLPSFEFHYNSSFHSSIGTAPWELLFGPKDHNFQSHPDRWKTIQQIREKAKQTALRSKDKQKQAHDKRSQEPKFEIGQLVWLKVNHFPNQNHKIASHWTGPVLITELQDHSVRVRLDSGRIKKVNLDQIKPFQDETLSKGVFKKGERPGQQQFLQMINQTLIKPSALINHQQTPSQAHSEEFEERETQAKQLIKNLQANQEQLKSYLRRLYLGILINQNPELEALTPSEKLLYDRYTGWERSLITTGNPIGIPEYRTGLHLRMPGRTTMGPMGPPPPPPPGPAIPPPPIPVPAPPQPGPSRSHSRSTSQRRMGRDRRTPTPSDRKLRSAGPAEERSLPPPTRKPRARPTPAASTPEPEESGPNAPTPTPEPEIEASLMDRITSLGRSFLFGGATTDDPSGGGPSAGVSQTLPKTPFTFGLPRLYPDHPGIASEDEWEHCSF